MNNFSVPQRAPRGGSERTVPNPVRPSDYVQHIRGVGVGEETAPPGGEPERGSALAPLLENPEEEIHPGEEARRVKVVKDPMRAHEGRARGA